MFFRFRQTPGLRSRLFVTGLWGPTPGCTPLGRHNRTEKIEWIIELQMTCGIQCIGKCFQHCCNGYVYTRLRDPIETYTTMKKKSGLFNEIKSTDVQPKKTQGQKDPLQRGWCNSLLECQNPMEAVLHWPGGSDIFLSHSFATINKSRCTSPWPMTYPREKYGPCFVHASSSGELPKWRSHVSAYGPYFRRRGRKYGHDEHCTWKGLLMNQSTYGYWR